MQRLMMREEDGEMSKKKSTKVSESRQPSILRSSAKEYLTFCRRTRAVYLVVNHIYIERKQRITWERGMR
jgi:hypothetical protein